MMCAVPCRAVPRTATQCKLTSERRGEKEDGDEPENEGAKNGEIGGRGYCNDNDTALR